MAASTTLLFFIVTMMVSLAAAGPQSSGQPISRAPRFFFPWSFTPNCGRNCPLHHCSIDPAVIHGYCCGCAQLFDRVPITCPVQLQCPLHPEPLCSDYNFMMDCCC
ncbi:uncharacterized protein [Anabrus simplex]|uniref:uncharacterized protein n=1 Tax=Anabrus simplex TaxID=316456 RepID=UPI0035A2C53D